MSRLHHTTRPVRYAWTSLLVALSACQNTTNFNSEREFRDGGLDAEVEEDAASDAGLSLGQNEAGSVAMCGTRPCACSNGDDDDGDKLIDGFDPECTGPYDDDEATFRVNDVRGGSPKCDDCFYDDNPGSGDDGCRIPTSCSLNGTPSSGTGSCNNCAPSAQCINRCLPITPNGCDCFGCCEVTHAGVTRPVRLVSTCTAELIMNSNACPACHISETCFNACEACELCPGKTRADLPSECMNVIACGSGGRCESPRDCDPSTEYCSQGCCVPILL